MRRFPADLIPALITPFTADGAVDEQRLGQMAVHLIQEGCNGMLVNGTTGESPTMDTREKERAITVVKTALDNAFPSKAIPLMAGVGTNDTSKTIDAAKRAADLGVDALLVVVPYYNKPSQRGMIAHFEAVAKATPLPVIIYNIPGRVVVRMTVDTMATLHAECPNIIGVKQSFGDMDAVSEIVATLPKETWTTWCGDDSLTLPMMACGATGVISVSAHLIARHLRALVDAFKAGNIDQARTLHLQLLDLNRDLFFLPNPTVVKACLAKLGYIAPHLRLPLVWPDATEMTKVEGLLARYQQWVLPATVGIR
jgi:4-hydroxy-tetrahydrodipicolinate synthase